MGLHRVLGMRVGVPDPTALADYYGELGLTGSADGSFTGSDGGAAVQVEQYDFRRLLQVTIGADDDATVAAAATRLVGMGLDARVEGGELSVVDPHTRVTFTVRPAERFTGQAPPTVPGENAPGLTVRRNRRANGVFAGPRPPRRLGHMVIGTPDLDATRDLLVHGLGFKVSDEFPGIIAFLRCSTDHHNVALVGSPVPTLQHYSWECDDVDHVGHTATSLLRTDPERHTWGFGRHHLGSNYFWYLRDPAGSFLELYSDMDVIDDDEAWEREGRTPIGFEHITNSWGPAIPTEFIAPTDLPELQAAWAARS
jgi:catechol 2,3-dioxygenase-like lactoylglutathione lyase family enzyme